MRARFAGLACVLVVVAPAAPAAAQPTLSVTDTCAYAGARFALNGNGFEPRTAASIELMSTADPLAGEPLSAHEAIADAAGRINAVLDVPATGTARRVARSVRVRPRPDAAVGMPTLLASAPLKTAARGVAVSRRARRASAGATERWAVTGLPEGTRLWAHYRHGARTVARVALGGAEDPCGRLDFALRTLPAGHERAGEWDVWLTSKRTFRVPRRGVYVQRRMTVASAGADAAVTFAPLRMRLVPADARAVAPVTNAFAADATRIGLISLTFAGAAGAPVDFFERIGDRLRPLGTSRAAAGEATRLDAAATWSCTRLTRRFVASATLPDGASAAGAHSVRTPSCASRFRVTAPRRAVAGRRVAVRVVDRWGNGAITPTLCVTPAGGERSCRRLPFAPAVVSATRRVRAGRSGILRIDLRIGASHLRSSVAVGERRGVRRPAPTLLATGDSMMQGIDSFLADELGESARVRSDVRVGTGITKTDTDWTQIAAAQVAAFRPRDTVISIGAADGFAMTAPDGARAACCDEPWVAEYARRVRAMMQTYAPAPGRRAFWLMLPLPRQAARSTISHAVNAAILRAAEGAAGVGVVRLDELFTPAGYRDVMRHRGRMVRVREIDGVHLSVAGTAIAARVIARLVRRPAR